MALTAGFEPAVRFWRTPPFQDGCLSHSHKSAMLITYGYYEFGLGKMAYLAKFLLQKLRKINALLPFCYHFPLVIITQK